MVRTIDLITESFLTNKGILSIQILLVFHEIKATFTPLQILPQIPPSWPRWYLWMYLQFCTSNLVINIVPDPAGLLSIRPIFRLSNFHNCHLRLNKSHTWTFHYIPIFYQLNQWNSLEKLHFLLSFCCTTRTVHQFGRRPCKQNK